MSFAGVGISCVTRAGEVHSRERREYNLRETLQPTAEPRAIGSMMEAAGLAKTAAGMVREGMKVVIFVEA